MKKILLIDPWGIDNTAEYLNGLVKGLTTNNQVTLATNQYYISKSHNQHIKVHRLFFRVSEHMKSGMLRRCIRGCEYIIGYLHIIALLNRETFDVVHINWLLMYSVDVNFLKIIKKKGFKIVYTAHNITPHTNAEGSIAQLHQIYDIVDRIVVHGENIKQEFVKYFPAYEEKLYVQKHGANLLVNTCYKKESIPIQIKKRVKEASRIYLYVGIIFYNKGVDRLFNAWKDMPRDHLLIVAGKNRGGDYAELSDSYQRVKQQENVLFINEYISQDMHNYLLHNCDIVMLPYRHASMSGVVFTAADFSKPIFTTNVGAIPEYINDKCGIVVENKDDLVYESMLTIPQLSDDKLCELGRNLSASIREECNWQTIAEQLVHECYDN